MDFNNSRMDLLKDNNVRAIFNGGSIGGLKRKMDIIEIADAVDDESNPASTIKKHIALNIKRRKNVPDMSSLGTSFEMEHSLNCDESLYNSEHSFYKYSEFSDNIKLEPENSISPKPFKKPQTAYDFVNKDMDYNVITESDFYQNENSLLEADIKQENCNYSSKNSVSDQQSNFYSIVEKRKIASTKEKRRLERMNDAFKSLRTCIPIALFEKSDRRPSKVQTLRLATYYIKLLSELLDITSKLSDDEIHSAYGSAIIDSDTLEECIELSEKVENDNISSSDSKEEPVIPNPSIETCCSKIETIINENLESINEILSVTINNKDSVTDIDIEPVKETKPKDEIIPSKILLDTDGIQRIIMEMYEPGSKHIPSFSKQIGDTVPEYLLEYICTCHRCENQCSLVSKYNVIGTGNVATYIIL